MAGSIQQRRQHALRQDKREQRLGSEFLPPEMTVGASPDRRRANRAAIEHPGVWIPGILALRADKLLAKGNDSTAETGETDAALARLSRSCASLATNPNGHGTLPCLSPLKRHISPVAVEDGSERFDIPPVDHWLRRLVLLRHGEGCLLSTDTISRIFLHLLLICPPCACVCGLPLWRHWTPAG
jgi:hypothetical protein